MNNSILLIKQGQLNLEGSVDSGDGRLFSKQQMLTHVCAELIGNSSYLNI